VESITEAEAREFLEESFVVHLGVIADGEPYVTPMSFVIDGDRLLFRTKAGRRFEALADGAVVSVEASDFNPETGDWMSVIVRGTAAEVTDEATVQLAHDMLTHKYRDAIGPLISRSVRPELPGTTFVFEVPIENISGRVSARGFSFRTKPGRL
jgi:uncharacterized protein